MTAKPTSLPSHPTPHFPECFRDATHHSCAIWEIERLTQRVAELERDLRVEREFNGKFVKRVADLTNERSAAMGVSRG